MLLLLFELDDNRYAIDARDVAEVLPRVHVKTTPRAPKGVAGLFNYRGTPVPLIDLSELGLGHPAALRLSTRIILIKAGSERGERPFGLLAERVTETVRCAPSDLLSPGLNSAGHAFLGPLLPLNGAFVQRIEIETLLTAELRALLAATALESV